MIHNNSLNSFGIIAKVSVGFFAAWLSFFIKGVLVAFVVLTAPLGLHSQSKSPANSFKDSKGFIENNGQLMNQFQQKNNGVKYLLNYYGMNIQLKKNSFSYDTYEILDGPAAAPKHDLINRKLKKPDSTIYHFHRIDIEFAGANPNPQIIPEEKSIYYSTYYTSGNSEGIKAHSFRRVVYKEIYPGIDVVFDTKNDKGKDGFEYYFIVKPGADASLIKLKYHGAETKLKNNRIVIYSKNGTIEERIPASFLVDKSTTDISQIKGKSAITVLYKATGNGTFKFIIPPYDKAKTLIIDPIPDLVWGTYYGAGRNDLAFTIARDPAGNILVGGGTQNVDMATSGAYQTVYSGFFDAMLGKFGGDGSMKWMTYYGGEWSDLIYGISSDNNGNVIITGHADSKTDIATPGCHQPIHGDSAHGRDGFLAKFDPAGKRLWATYFGGNGQDYSMGVKTDASGNIFIAGWTYSRVGISTPGSYQPVNASGPDPSDFGDGFIARFDNNGNRIWATYYGGTSFDTFYDLDLDNNGNIYASGITYSNGISSPGAFQTTIGGVHDAILVKFNNSGNRIWATYYGGDKADYSPAITCDQQNNVIIGGITFSNGGIATAGTHLPAFGGGTRDGFVAKFDENGKRLWGTYYGGNVEEDLEAITADENNNIFIAGATSSKNNIATTDAYLPVNPGPTGTVFIAKLNSSGNRLWGTYYGYGNPRGGGEAEDIVTDPLGNVFVCGQTMSPNGIASCNAIQKTWGGSDDMFVAMFSETSTAKSVSAAIVVSNNGTICAGIPTTFNVEVLNGGTNPTYQWLVNGVVAGTNSPVFTTNSLNDADKVSCTVTSNSPCINNPIANSNVITVMISPSVVPAVSITSTVAGSICPGTPVAFAATPSNGGSNPSYQWKINGNNAGTNSSVFTTSALADGDVVRCEMTNLSSCNAITTALSNNLTINVSATVIPSVTITATEISACAGEPITFTASALNAGTNPAYQWKVNGNSVASNLTYSTGILSNNDTVQCFLIPDNMTCAGSASIASNKIGIRVYPLPDFTIQPINPIVSKGDTVQLVVNGTNIIKYEWTPAVNISNNAINDPMVWPVNTQTYTLKATSPDGCTTSKPVTVMIITEVFVPSAFTPNGDGLNDYWVINGLELYPGSMVSIFNRWGQIVYQYSGNSKPWDGRVKDQDPSTATFVYLIDLRNGKKLSGTVTVIR